MKKKVLLNLINANQGAHLIRSYHFLKNIKKEDKKNIYYIFSERKYSIQAKNIKYFNFIVKNNIILRIIYRFYLQNLLINFFCLKNDVDIYLNFSHTVPLFFLKKIKVIIAVTNLAPFINFTNFSLFFKIRFFLLKLKILYSCQVADKIICISKYCKKILIKKNIKADKLVIAYNGIENIKTKPSKKSNYFLYVSHFYSYKNFENLILAYYHLPIHVKKKYNLIFIGKPYDHKYYQKIKSMICQLNLQRKIIIKTNLVRFQIDKYLSNCKAFIFPSFVENCPMSLLEAIKFQKPILTSKIPPMNEFTDSNDIIFNPKYFNSIKKSIILFLNRNKKKVKKTKLIKKLSWNNFFKKIKYLY